MVFYFRNHVPGVCSKPWSWHPRLPVANLNFRFGKPNSPRRAANHVLTEMQKNAVAWSWKMLTREVDNIENEMVVLVAGGKTVGDIEKLDLDRKLYAGAAHALRSEFGEIEEFWWSKERGL